MIKVQNIGDLPWTAPAITDLITATWPDHYGTDGAGDAARTIADRIAARTGGVCVRDGTVIGTAAISETSFGSRPTDDGLWLIGLCVDVAARRQGIGSALVRWAVDYAGETPLFTTTKNAAGLLRRLGWTKVRDVTDNNGTWSVFRAPQAGQGS